MPEPKIDWTKLNQGKYKSYLIIDGTKARIDAYEKGGILIKVETGTEIMTPTEAILRAKELNDQSLVDEHGVRKLYIVEGINE